MHPKRLSLLMLILVSGFCVYRYNGAGATAFQTAASDQIDLLIAPQVRVLSSKRLPLAGVSTTWHRVWRTHAAEPYPIRGNKVECGPQPLSSKAPVFTAVTDEQGVAVGALLPEGTYLVSAQDGAQSAQVVLNLREGQGGVCRSSVGCGLPVPVDLYLHPYHDVRARVVSAQGKPLEGAVVALSNPDHWSSRALCNDGHRHLRVIHGLTDKLGLITWRISSCDPEHYEADRLHLHLLCNGRDATTVEHRVSEPGAVVTLISPDIVSVHFQLPKDEPSVSAQALSFGVMLSWQGNASEHEHGTNILDTERNLYRGCVRHTRDNRWAVQIPPGGQTLSCFSPGLVSRFRVTALGHSTQDQPADFLNGANVNLNLGAALAKLTFRLRASDGLSLNEVKALRFLRLNGDTVDPDHVMREGVAGYSLFVEPHDYGHLHFDTSDAFPLFPCPIADYWPLESGQIYDLGEFEYPVSRGFVHGRIVSPAGKPLSGAIVNAWGSRAKAGGTVPRGTLTGPDGTFILRLESALSTKVFIRARHQFLISELVETDGTEPLELSLKLAGSARVNLRLTPAFRDQIVLRIRSTDSAFERRVNCDASGLANTGPLPAGTYCLSGGIESARDIQSAPFSIKWGEACAPDISKITRALAEYESAEVTVTNSLGQPIPGVRVEVYATGLAAESETYDALYNADHQGRVHFLKRRSANPLLCVGTVGGFGSGSYAQSFAAPKHFPTTVALRKLHPLSISFSAEFPRGSNRGHWSLRLKNLAPWPEAMLRATAQDLASARRRQDPRGSFNSPNYAKFYGNVAEGHYQLEAYWGKGGFRWDQMDTVPLGMIEVDGMSPTIDFTLNPSMLAALRKSQE